MSRLLAALLAASLLLPAGALAQAAQNAPAPASAEAAKPAPVLKPAAPAAGQLDPSVRDYVDREVERRVREELQNQQFAQQGEGAKDWAGTAGAGDRARLDFLQVNGYLRTRFELFDNLDLHRTADPSGYFLFPRPLRDADNRGTLTSDNMRLRLEPTLNVSEQIRVLSQVDLLDNIVLGSTPSGFFSRSDGAQFPFDARGQAVPTAGVNGSSNSISVKRAWAEVQTPVGLLSFGRMPSSWGLGILSHAGGGIDDDLGDSVDRLQFALTPLPTPLGKLVLVPMYEIVATGVTTDNGYYQGSMGQPIDRDPGDDVKALGLKIVRADTDEEMKRKWDRGEVSTNFGLWYLYRSQTYEFPQWYQGVLPPVLGGDVPYETVRRDASTHTVDAWWRVQTRKFRWETELTGVFGSMHNAGSTTNGGVGPVSIVQWGGASQAYWQLEKFRVGGEVGIASGDSNPGWGYRTGRNCTLQAAATLRVCTPLDVGSYDGLQFAPGDRSVDVSNFRFNPAYRVDLILFREIIGGVTDAWYVKPSASYEVFDGLNANLSVMYANAMEANSTPSTENTPLGVEVDLGLNYKSDDGFLAWLNAGVFQPMGAFDYGSDQTLPTNRENSRAWTIRTGLAVKF